MRSVRFGLLGLLGSVGILACAAPPEEASDGASQAVSTESSKDEAGRKTSSSTCKAVVTIDGATARTTSCSASTALGRSVTAWVGLDSGMLTLTNLIPSKEYPQLSSNGGAGPLLTFEGSASWTSAGPGAWNEVARGPTGRDLARITGSATVADAKRNMHGVSFDMSF